MCALIAPDQKVTWQRVVLHYPREYKYLLSSGERTIGHFYVNTSALTVATVVNTHWRLQEGWRRKITISSTETDSPIGVYQNGTLTYLGGSIFTRVRPIRSEAIWIMSDKSRLIQYKKRRKGWFSSEEWIHIMPNAVELPELPLLLLLEVYLHASRPIGGPGGGGP